MPEDVKEFRRLSEAAPHTTSPTELIQAAADTVAPHDTMVHPEPWLLDVAFLIVMLYLTSHHTVSHSLSLECV